jgi:hypothetical protein
MRLGRTIFFFFTLAAFTSCKTYEVMHYQGSDVDKLGGAGNYKVYVHSQKNIFKITKPSISPAGVSGNAAIVTDHQEAEEIRAPGTPGLVKKHRNDLNLFTKTVIPDSAANINLKKAEITGYSLTISHSHIKWDKIGNAIALVLGVAVCIALIGALVYWFTYI